MLNPAGGPRRLQSGRDLQQEFPRGVKPPGLFISISASRLVVI
jgi:hypothetical protein